VIAAKKPAAPPPRTAMWRVGGIRIEDR